MSQTELKPVPSSLTKQSSPASANSRDSSRADLSRPGSTRGDTKRGGDNWSGDEAQQSAVCSVLCELAVSAAIDQKALDLKAIDVSRQCSFADNFLIVSGTSERHAKGIADRIIKRLKSSGYSPLSITGNERGEWIVLDFGELIVHVFFEPSRQFYELDVVWEGAPPVPLAKELQEEIRFLRTGSFR